MIKIDIFEQMKIAFEEVDKTLIELSENNLFQTPETKKWSVAENIEHLFLSSKPLVGLFGDPSAMLQNWGLSNRKSKEYKEIVRVYQDQLKLGTPTTSSYTPRPLDLSKEELIQKFKTINVKLLEKANTLSEDDLDNYQVPHPILGLLTCREFLYFTWYHTIHHLKIIKKMH